MFKQATQSSGEKTADALIFTGRAYFSSIVVMPDGANAVTIAVYDAITGTGDLVLPTITFAGDGGAQSTPPVWCAVQNGIYVDITTDGSVKYAVFYRGRQ